jgi:hypothetical protein
MMPFQFLTEALFLNDINDDILVSIVDGEEHRYRFFWGSDNIEPDAYGAIRFTGTIRGFIDMYNSLVDTNEINDYYHPHIPEIDVIILPYERGVLTFASNGDHRNLPNFHNWTVSIDYRIYYRNN